MRSLALPVSDGLNVTTSPFLRPIASCLPLGDQATNKVLDEEANKDKTI